MPLVEGRDAQNNETANYHSSAREGSKEPIFSPPEIDDSESKDWLGSDQVLSISLIILRGQGGGLGLWATTIEI